MTLILVQQETISHLYHYMNKRRICRLLIDIELNSSTKLEVNFNEVMMYVHSGESMKCFLPEN